MLTELLFPHVPGLHVERIWAAEGAVQVEADMRCRFGRCPCCHRRSRHVHSHYERTLADCPCSGQTLTLHLRVRRFRCRVRWCPLRIFAERLPDLARPHARRTERQRQVLQRHAVDLGGEAGARHCLAEALVVSARTLLRLVRQLALPAVETVRVLGVDDFAKRRGQRYGTILVNLETHEVIDLLPDRTAETLTAWLRPHPEIEVISRDRAGAYAEGARLGAPQATQIADRFHLDKNVTEALERYLVRQHRSLRQAAQGEEPGPPAAGPTLADVAAAAPGATPAQPTAVALVPTPTAVAPATTAAPRAGRPTSAARLAADRRARRLGRYEEVVALAAQGHSIRAVASATGLARGTVRRFLRAGSFPERQRRAPHPTQLTPFLPYLQARWAEGCQNAVQLWRELRDRGFRGGRAAVSRLLQAWRPVPRRRTRRQPTETGAAPGASYSPRQTCWLLLKPPDQLAAAEQAYLTRLFHVCPQVALAQALAREFQTLIRARDVDDLFSWLRGVRQSGIAEFISIANGIWRDRQAVEAALTHPESQGQVEGQVNRLKLIKRAGYGRSGFDLLRIRVLLVT
jgi:transposase